jgi:hypothetical protein
MTWRPPGATRATPPGYDCTPDATYPVVVFNDGHDLFDWYPDADGGSRTPRIRLSPRSASSAGAGLEQGRLLARMLALREQARADGRDLRGREIEAERLAQDLRICFG